ncbi:MULTISPECIES: hypothetical protein [Calothrix]|nr:hypothetical protein [Calothrix anomala]
MKPNKAPKMLGFVPQTPLATLREAAPRLQAGKPVQRSGSPTYTKSVF